MTAAATQVQDDHYQEGKKWLQRVTMQKRFYSHLFIITLNFETLEYEYPRYILWKTISLVPSRSMGTIDKVIIGGNRQKSI